jgi:hypothetical protein
LRLYGCCDFRFLENTCFEMKARIESWMPPQGVGDVQNPHRSRCC